MFKKIAVLFVISLFLVTSPAMALTESIGGQLKQDVVFNNTTEKWQGRSLMELELDKSFGFDKNLYISSEIYTNYVNEKFTDLKIDVNEAYLDFYLKNSDLTIGKQIINWGSAYQINPSSMTNPYDLTALNPTDEKLGVPAVKNTYYFNSTTSLTGVIITDFVESPVPDSLKQNMVKGIKADFAEQLVKQKIASNIKEGYGLVDQNLNVIQTKPEIDELSELEYAFNFMKRNVSGFDLSASYFNGYEDIPSITSDLGQVGRELTAVIGTTETTNLNVGYKRTQGLGLNAIGSISSIGVWSELNYQINEDDEKTIDLVLGGDYTFDNNLYTVAQYIHRGYSDYQISRGNMNYLLLHGDKPFRQIHTIKTNIIYDLGLGNYIFNPEMTFSLSNNINLDLGTVITGEEKGSQGYSLFNMMSGERTYFELTYNF